MDIYPTHTQIRICYFRFYSLAPVILQWFEISLEKYFFDFSKRKAEYSSVEFEPKSEIWGT